MLVQLTKVMRLRAANLLALLYTLCILAPAAAFAFGDGSRAAHCLTDDNHGLQRVQVHVHDDGTAHVHTGGAAASHEHSKAPDGQGKSSDAQCCGLVCLSALPASIAEIATPILPAMMANSALQEDIAGRPPERLLRPPISPLSL